MTTHNSGLPEGGAYQGNQQQQASRASGAGGNTSGGGSRGFSTDAYQQHAQSAASRTAALSHQAVLGVHPAAAAASLATNPLPAAAGYSATTGPAAAAHNVMAAAASGSSVVHPGAGMPRLDLRQQQQQQQQHQQQQQQRSAAAARYPASVSMQPNAISAAVAALAGAAGNDRVSRERPHHQSLAAQVQREAMGAPSAARQHQHQQQQQHAAVAAAASALRQQQHQQQHSLGLHQSSSHHPGAHHPPPPPHASRVAPSAAHAGYPMHNRQQLTGATIAQQHQQQQQQNLQSHPHYVAHHRRHQHHHHPHPHHPSHSHHPHHTTSHMQQQQQQQQQQRQAVRDQVAASRRAQVVHAAAQVAAAQQAQAQQTAAARRAQVASSLAVAAHGRRQQHPHAVVQQQQQQQQQQAHVHKDVSSSTAQQQQQQQQARSLPQQSSMTDGYPPPPVAADLVDQFDDPHPAAPPRPPPAPAPAPTSHRTMYEEQIVRQRSVLVDKYAPFIAASDKSLGDARKRLQKAHEQVQKLRAAFTERVYGKYRVCLRPPPSSEDTLRSIRADPIAATRRLEQEIRQLKQEKEHEKKEAGALNTEMAKLDPSALSSIGADNADQLMFVSAGLSLVILPEDASVDPKILEDYEDRGPVQLATGQRVRNISQAAASAGEIIIERTRKAVGIRDLLLRRRSMLASQEHHMLGGIADETYVDPMVMEILTSKTNPVVPPPAATNKAIHVASTGNDSSKDARAEQSIVSGKPTVVVAAAASKSVPTAATTTTTTDSKVLPPGQPEPPPAVIQVTAPDVPKVPKRGSSKNSTVNLQQQLSSAKFGRGGAGISVNISLSLNPTADELSLDPDKPMRASTAALLSRGIHISQGINKTSPQQRLKHPHPESSGGKQRASSATSAKKELASLTHAVAHPQNGPYQHSYLNLALPPLPTPTERREKRALTCVEHRCSGRAKRVIQSVLGHLQDTPGSGPVTKIGVLYGIQQSPFAQPDGVSEPPPGERQIDPSLAFSVLQAIGIVNEGGKKDSPVTPPSVLLDRKARVVVGGEKRKLSSVAKLDTTWNRIGFAKRPRLSDAFKSDNAVKENSSTTRETVMRSPSVENIRGGGVKTDDANGTSDSDSRKANHRNANAGYNNNNHVSANNVAQGVRQAQPRWDDPSRQSLVINSHLVAGNPSMVGGANQGHVAVSAPVAQQATANFNALQLAHQLRQHASNHNMAGLPSHQQGQGELQQVSNYLGGLQQSAPWSSLNNSAAAMAAAQSSLAALGLSVPMGVYDNPQERAARALLVREQQHVAAAHAVAAHQQSMSNSGFVGGAANPGFTAAPTSAQGASSQAAALLNSSVQLGAQVSALQNAAMPQQARNEILAAASMMAQRESGFRRTGADAPGNSNARAAANAGTASAPMPQKRKAESTTVGSNKPDSSKTVENKELLSAEAKKPKPSNSNPAAEAVKPTPPTAAPANGELKPAAASTVKSPSPSIKQQQQLPRAPVNPGNATLKIAPSAVPAKSVPKSVPSKVPEASPAAPQEPAAPPSLPPSGETAVVPSLATAKVVPNQPVAAQPTVKPGPTTATAAAPIRKAVVSQQAMPAKLPERKNHVVSVRGDKGLQFIPPAVPSSVSPEEARLVQMGRPHEALMTAAANGATVFSKKSSVVVEFLQAVGAAVPIPKAIISTSLKDRLNIPGFKNLAQNAGFVVPREIVIAVILAWLWNNHESDFQRAFARSGRIDVDPTCKWLVHAAADASVRALKQFIADSGTRSSLVDGLSDKSIQPDAVAVLVAGRALTAESSIVVDTDYALSQFHALTKFLDDCRVSALESRSQERVLLASLISLKSTMSESFAHAYVSSMVRAGDALGHEDLADLVSDEETMLSSMLPYDVMRDQYSMWEDPCRAHDGYSPKLTGDVLTKGAHARAMIQKSLRRLQDRHGIKGGTPTSGAYTDPLSGQSQSTAPGSAPSNSGGKGVNGTSGPKTWSRRKGATNFVLEGPVPNGTGSAQATSWQLYDPKHYSAPLSWNCDAPENTPYGSALMKRSASSQGQNSASAKKKKGLNLATDGDSPVDAKALALGRTTHEIDWRTMADNFEHVKLPGGNAPASAPSPHASAAAANLKTIVSPFCRQLQQSPVPSDDESDSDEDLSDEAVLGRHQIVLDGMKEKLTAFMEARKRQQERKKNRQKSNS